MRFPIFVITVSQFLSLGTVTCDSGSLKVSKQKTSKTKRESASPYVYHFGSSDSSANLNNNANVNTDFSAGYHYSTPKQWTKSSGFSPRSLLALPKGSRLTITPLIDIPLIDDSEFGVGSSFTASLPISIKLDEFKWVTINNDIFNKDWGNKKPYRKSFMQDYGTLANEIVMDQPLSRKARDLRRIKLNDTMSGNHSGPTSSYDKCQRRNLRERLAIIQKLETVANGIGIENPKACLLRAACEVHDLGAEVQSIGLVGEFLTTILSIEHVSRGCSDYEGPVVNLLLPYIKAEIAGKSGKCRIYKKQCTSSMFEQLL
ncbi:hypothetical protein Ocin01_02227 [Orchesella cincta]|uniref:Uncharacterized protein n=1 Tax=Orchesella cincta TaxID=48709 RepID=A0A1D2NGQ4_ORCCI|nr:hypothetical protein Ocin01_02227 [Orchesella cincta]